jgi:endonuclease-8
LEAEQTECSVLRSMEGPSLFLAAEQLQPFTGKKILRVEGNTTIGKERLKSEKVIEIFSWGKHLVFQFEHFALKVHFLLYGSFEALVNKVQVTGDYKRTRTPRLVLAFRNGEIRMFNCSVKFIEDPNFKASYYFKSDTMSPEWDEKLALKKIKEFPEEEIGDVLLDQDIFAGVGNIIKNEILFLTRINPKKKISSITAKKRKEIINQAQSFSYQFYEWRKIFQLKKHLVIYRKSVCPICETKVVREKTGKSQRWSFYCPKHQPLSRPKKKI